MRAQLERLLAEWRQSRRLRLGVLVILLVLGLNAILVLSDRQAALAEAYRRDADLLQRLDEASRESSWPERADQAEAALEETLAGIAPVANAGLAQAELQAWLAGQAAQAGLEESRVRAEATLDVPDRPELWQVVARLDGRVPEGRLPALLQSLSGGLPWIQVERIDISSARQTQVSLVVRAYYRKAEAAPAPAGADATGGTP